MKLLAALLVSLILAGPARGQTPISGPATISPASAEELMGMQLLAWSLACEAKRVNCQAFVPPYVGYSLLPGRFGQYIIGELTIAVDIRLMAQPVSILVMVHEMIHYLQWATGQKNPDFPRGYMTACAGEQEAFELTWQVNSELQLVDPNIETRLKPWSSARRFYPGCEIAALKEEGPD